MGSGYLDTGRYPDATGAWRTDIRIRQDSATREKHRNRVALSNSFKSHLITNVFDDSNRGHWLLSRDIGGNTWRRRARALAGARPPGSHRLCGEILKFDEKLNMHLLPF